MLAYRVGFQNQQPVFPHTRCAATTQRSAVVAVTLFTPNMIRQLEMERNLRVYLFYQGEQMYFTHKDDMSASGSDMADAVLTIHRQGLWVWKNRVYFADMRRLGNGEIVAVCLRPATAFVLNIAQGVLVIVVIALTYFILLQYFVVNYHMISAAYRNIFDSLPDYICLTNRKGRIKYINREMSFALFGLPPKAVVYARPTQLQGVALFERIAEIEREVRLQQFPRQTELTDGDKTYSVLHVPVEFSDGIEVVTCVRDLTHHAAMRHDAETWKHSAMLSQQLLHAVFENSPDWMCIFDDDGTVLSAGAQMTRETHGEFGRFQQDLVEARDRTQQNFTWTVSLFGVTRTFAATCLQVQSAPNRYILIASDVTIHTTWQEELESVVSMVTAHILRQNERKQRTDRIMEAVPA